MPKFIIPIVVSLYEHLEVEAQDLAEAKRIAKRIEETTDTMPPELVDSEYGNHIDLIEVEHNDICEKE